MSSSTPPIGMIGVGLMGHGIAWNIAHAGYRLTVLDHPGNQPVDDLRAMGVRVLPRIADVVSAVEIVILCVTGTPQVEAILNRRGRRDLVFAAWHGGGGLLYRVARIPPSEWRRRLPRRAGSSWTRR